MKVREPHLDQVGETFYARVGIPADVRAAIGKGADFRASLLTKDINVARKKRDEIVKAWKAEIAQARAGLQPGVETPVPTTDQRPRAVEFRPGPERVNREQACTALRRWRIAEVAKLRDDYFSGIVPAGFKLRKPVADARLDGLISEALNSQGAAIEPHHPAVANLRNRMRDELGIIKQAEAAFADGDLDWSEASPQFTQTAVQVTPPKPAAPRIVDFLDRWVETKRVASYEQTDARYVVRRLSEYLRRNPTLDDVSTDEFVAFSVAFAKLPKSQKPEVRALDIHESIRRFADDESVQKVSSVTVWKQMCLLGRVFRFAQTLRLISENPTQGAIPLKGEFNARQTWSHKDIADIFSRPMFTGFAGPEKGYRDKAGNNLVRDVRYWLPILSLWHGTRMEEFGAALASEIVQDEITGIWFLDLRSRKLDGPRPVKNAESQRRVPIHSKLIDLGFLKYTSEQRDRGPDAYLFPGLPHGNASGESSTHWYSTAWRNWVRKNAALLDGSTFDSKTKVFHSFRHTWKQRAREMDIAIPEEYSDALDGHSSVSVGRKYGDYSLVDLQHYMNRIAYPTFPL